MLGAVIFVTFLVQTTAALSTSRESFVKDPRASSKGWSDAAKVLLEATNLDADPCENFFEYSCGGWNKKNPIPEGKPRLYIYDQIQDTISGQIVESLDDVSPKSSSTAIVKTKVYFDTCVNALLNNASFYDDVRSAINDTFGGWPLTGIQFQASKFDVATWVGRLSRHYGLDPILAGGVDIDFSDSKKTAFIFDQGSLGLILEYYNDSAIMEEYADLILVNAMLFGASNNSKTQADVKEVVDFETALSKIVTPASERRTYTQFVNPFQLGSVLRSRKWNMQNYLDAQFDGVDEAVRPQSSDRVYVYEPKYVEQMQKIIDATPDETIANFLIWRFVYRHSTFLPELREQTKRLKHKTEPRMIGFKSEEQEDKVECAQMVVSSLPFTAGRIYVEKHFTDEDKNIVSQITNSIMNSFTKTLTSLDWFDEVTRSAALKKINNMAMNVGWPTWIYNDHLLDAYHDSLDIQASYDHLKAFWRIIDFQTDVSLRRLGHSVNRHDFGMSPAIVNAWYNPVYNAITIPAAILQYPQYRSDFPMSINYGATGNTPGHEVTHGFDDEGVQFDWEGSLKPWITNSSKTAFDHMAQCIQDQYSSFCPIESEDKKLCLNGKTNQGENIADNGGMRHTFYAYKEWIKTHGEEPRLPGLEHLSHEQIYFLAFGLSWCGSETPAYLEKIILTNPHSPPKYRVLGTLQNFPEFGKAFGCTRGNSTMFPKDACKVWTNLDIPVVSGTETSGYRSVFLFLICALNVLRI